MTMTAGERQMLHSYIDNATHYLEFGAGASTVYASNAENVKRIDSVESSGEYINAHLAGEPAVREALQGGRLTFYKIDIGETVKWGYPKDNSKRNLWGNYSSEVFRSNKDYDLVLIDGRFRVACALNTVLHTPADCVIIIHDFWNRPEYHCLLKYLNVKEQVDTLGVFTKKRNISTARMKSLIKKYQFRPGDYSLSYKIQHELEKFFLRR